MTISPLKFRAAGARHISSVMLSNAGVRQDQRLDARFSSDARVRYHRSLHWSDTAIVHDRCCCCRLATHASRQIFLVSAAMRGRYRWGAD